MGPLTYALCHKSLVGPALWITGLCAFPPLFSDVALPLGAEGTTVATAFFAPVDRKYQLVLNFEFATSDERLQDTTVGSSYRAECDKDPSSILDKPQYGQAIPIRVVIRKAENNAVIIDEQFTTLCIISHRANQKTRSIGWVSLARGKYTAEITNIAAQKGLGAAKVSVALVPGGSK
jgi:hypothetical protein